MPDVNSENDTHAEEEKKMFFTTSDLMAIMNKSSGGNFELKRRMPDGSTKRADESDIAVADLQAKIKQAAYLISKLTPPQKLEWAKKQRVEGNRLFAKKEYRDAMDVYITCLVAMDNANEPDGRIQGEHLEVEDHPMLSQRENIEKEILLPVLLNLSLCTLNLGLLRKTQEFCNLAIDIPSGKKNVKVYFRRGKARMLMGNYHESRLDFNMALQIIEDDAQKISSAHPTEPTAAQKIQFEKKAVLKEMRKLESLEQIAKSNHRKQEKAMKKILGGTVKSSADNAAKNEMKDSNKEKKRGGKIENESYTDVKLGYQSHLYHDKGVKRQFSDLRSKSSSRQYANEDRFVDDENPSGKIGFTISLLFYAFFALAWHFLVTLDN